jgi:hypothetical protein
MWKVHPDLSVVNENTGMKQNPDLEMFNPQNGFNPAGSSYARNSSISSLALKSNGTTN